tara:strand:+ start:5318 stop:5989 length:672 start_codon:yes stop_codon:yes gene_type:complete
MESLIRNIIAYFVNKKVAKPTVKENLTVQKEESVEKEPKEIEVEFEEVEPSVMMPTNEPLITTRQIIDIYGEPDETGSYLTTIDLPYPMRLSWDLDRTVTRMRCHKLLADKFLAVFNDILVHYGIERIKELGIDLFGGCFSFRKMRGGKDWSRHSWGIAIDLDPFRNGLKTKWKDAQFSKEEYRPMMEIFYKHGFQNLGLEADMDAMHMQASYKMSKEMSKNV